MPAAKTTALAPELEQIRGILAGWRPSKTDDQFLRQALISHLETISVQAIYDRDKGTLTCPHCEWVGLIGDEPQEGEEGTGFRYLEAVNEWRSVDGIKAGDAGVEQKYDTLKIDSSAYNYNDDTGEFARLECRNCLAECALPEGLEIDFV